MLLCISWFIFRQVVALLKEYNFCFLGDHPVYNSQVVQDQAVSSMVEVHKLLKIMKSTAAKIILTIGKLPSMNC